MDTSTLPDDDIVDQVINADRIDEENYRFYDEHSEELVAEYGGQLIAIIDSEVVANRDATHDIHDIEEFFNELRRDYGEHDARTAYITRVPDSDEMLLL